MDVERHKSKKKVSALVMTDKLVTEALMTYLENSQDYMKFGCDGVSARSLSESDLVESFVNFDFVVTFELPKEQTASCYGGLFNVFTVTGWVAKKLRTVHIAEYRVSTDNLRFGCFDDGGRQPEVDEMISVLGGCAELPRKR